MGRRKVFKDDIYVLFRAEKEAYEAFKKICYDKIGVTPSDLFRSFMESILRGEKGIVITRRPVHTAITITKTKDVELNELPFDVGSLVLTEQVRIGINDLKRSMKQKASPNHIRALRDRLLDLCKKARTLDPALVKDLKQALSEARIFLKEEEAEPVTLA